MADQSARDQLEHAAVECLGTESATTIQLSIAISLRRIADTLDGTSAGLCVTETIFGGRERG